MSFTVEQKSLLAKLMATENLTVQHQKIQTAKFDPKNRVLYLPIWQHMQGFMYDHLTGHEVGHALYTPAEGWHDAATDKSKGSHYRNFLNVVEDCRIEKKIKRKYPGLNSSFRQGFAELMNRDFFNLEGRELNGLSFIDRLNVYSKSQWTYNINFSDEEQILIEKVQACETWEDVLRVTAEVYDYSKDEQFEMRMQDFEGYGDGDDEYEFNDEDESYMDGAYDENQTPSKSNSSKSEDSEAGDESDEKAEGNANGKADKDSDEQTESDDNGTRLNRFKDSQPSGKDQFNPRCETDEAFRENENTLLDAKSREYIYLKVPKANFTNILTKADRVQAQMTEYYEGNIKEGYYTMQDIQTLVNDFKNKNDRYVGLLAKEFEMRKAAKAFSKSKLSDTGDIDINKLSSYKFDDNIFRKVMLVPKGKNHGLILLLDCSGSMSDNMAGSIEQILVLSMFCRKVNIPFIVYGFHDSPEVRMLDMKVDQYDYAARTKATAINSFSQNVGEINLGVVYLREYLNSRMSNSEFSKALRNMVLLKSSYAAGRSYGGRFGRPASESLSNTPLTQAIYAVGQLMPAFRSKFNIDLTSLVIVHDGDADRTDSYYTMGQQFSYKTGKQETSFYAKGFNSTVSNVIITDERNKYQYQINPAAEKDSYRDYMLEGALDWFQKTTRSKVFGFFLVAGGKYSMKNAVYNRYVFADGTSFYQLRRKEEREAKENFNKGIYNSVTTFQDKQKRIVETIKSEKFVLSNVKGYTEFYLVAGGSDLMTSEDEIEIDGKVTSSKLKNAFMKMNKKKQVSRVLVSRFIQGMAA